MSRITVEQTHIERKADGVELKLYVTVVKHVDGSCYIFCDAGKYWQDDPAIKDHCEICISSGPDQTSAMQTAWKQAESFAERLVKQKLIKKAERSFKGLG